MSTGRVPRIDAAGVAEGFSLPTEWSVANGTNIAWKADVPGLGLSSPVVWGNDAFISTSISGQKDAGLKVGLYGDVRPVLDDTEHEWRIYAFDKKTGKEKWQQTVLKSVPKIKRHTKASHANSTMATDGERLIAFFGSEGLYAYDLKGKLLWKKDLGVTRRRLVHGRAAARQRVVVALRDLDGHTADEVSQLLTITAGNQRVLLHRGRAVVRAHLERYYESAALSGQGVTS